jgi:hypothetical protein
MKSRGKAVDNLNMDNHDSGDEQSFISRMMENSNARLAAALAVGLIVGSGATWATLRTDSPKKPKAVVEQRRVENRANPVQTNNSASTRPSTKKVSLKVALKDCNKITNKNKKAACISRTKKAYAKSTSSTTKRTSSAKPASSTKRVTSNNVTTNPRTVEIAKADTRKVSVAE